ncbi:MULTISPECIES: hypothetical protein [Caldanaerobacter]|uniref:hypothetical protein n=1 Tax=Caldanaerobacter TaxID=249529 RepID=UPI00241E6664|nr:MULTISPECIES: hypothetical protein [Caldanaerobacter]
MPNVALNSTPNATGPAIAMTLKMPLFIPNNKVRARITITPSPSFKRVPKILAIYFRVLLMQLCKRS